MIFRKATTADAANLRSLALASWTPFRPMLEPQHWQLLFNNLDNIQTYTALLTQAHSFVCEDAIGSIIGMAFLVPSGNPTDIYPADWSYIRFVSVHPDFAGKGIGGNLTVLCIETAKALKEHTIALHTSEIMPAARHIYERLGFTIMREIESQFGKRYWLYALQLSNQ
jgi:ribosomal protein S18 acetylase RimI-like enzyme